MIEVPPIYDGEAMTDRKSKFQAHLASVSKKEQVRQTLFCKTDYDTGSGWLW